MTLQCISLSTQRRISLCSVKRPYVQIRTNRRPVAKVIRPHNVMHVGKRPRLGYHFLPSYSSLLAFNPHQTMPNKRKPERVFIIGVGCTAFIKPRGTRTTNDVRLSIPPLPTKC